MDFQEGSILIDALLVKLDEADHETHMELLDELISRALDYKDSRTDDTDDANRES